MDVYFVGPPGGSNETYRQQMQGKRVLHSYATCRYLDVPEGTKGYCLDSGAFTAWKKGKAIDMERLLRWYELNDTADFKFMLDVIGGDESAQRRNLNVMEREGQDVVPVFHGPGLESWKWFDELCERYPLIALGAVTPKNTSEATKDWLDQVFSRICDRSTGEPKVRVHGLRMTSQMQDYPFSSVDGSAWVTASKNNRMPMKYGTRQRVADREYSRLTLQQMWIDAWTECPKATRYEGKRAVQFSLF